MANSEVRPGEITEPVQAPVRSGHGRRISVLAGATAVAAVIVGAVLALLATGVFNGGEGIEQSDSGEVFTVTKSQPAATPAPFVPDNRLVRNLSLALTEQAAGTVDAEVDAVFGHPSLLVAAQGPVGMDETSIVIFVNENIHVDTFTTEQPTVWLRVDGSERYEPTDSRVTRSDIHHRTVRFEWDIPGLPELTQFAEEEHRLVLLLDPVSLGNTLTWDLPLTLSSSLETAISRMFADLESNSGLSGPATGLSYLESGTIASRRELFGVAYDGVRGIEISATFGTPEYLESVFPPNEAAEYVSGSRSVFIVQEISASDALPVSPPALELEVGGKVFRPSQVEERFSSEQQRMNIYTYPASAGAISTATEMALVLPAGSKLIWELVDGKPIR